MLIFFKILLRFFRIFCFFLDSCFNTSLLFQGKLPPFANFVLIFGTWSVNIYWNRENCEDVKRQFEKCNWEDLPVTNEWRHCEQRLRLRLRLRLRPVVLDDVVVLSQSRVSAWPRLCESTASCGRASPSPLAARNFGHRGVAGSRVKYRGHYTTVRRMEILV